MRDIEHKANERQKNEFKELLERAKRLLAQRKHSANKLYSVRAPEVECIAKGKVGKKYEFGCKASLVVSHKEGLVLCAQAQQGNPCYGHTLKEALTNAATHCGTWAKCVFVDKGYQKHGVESVQVLMSGQKGLPSGLKKALKRHNVIEAHIGHMKSDGKLGKIISKEL